VHNDTFTFIADPTCTTIEMPVLFTEHRHYDGFALALTINHVNCMVDGTTVFSGDPQESGTVMGAYVENLFRKAGYDDPADSDDGIFLAISSWYHNSWGNIHCGTNTRRTWPSTFNWWD